MNVLVANGYYSIRNVAVRIALGALVLSAIGLATGSGPAMAQDTAPEGLQFKIQCSQTSSSPDGGIGSVTCTLIVSGLPSPLTNQVTVIVLSTDDVVDSPSDPGTSETVVSSEAPSISPGSPVLVSRRLPAALPSPPPISPHVPTQPPKSL